MRSMQSFPAAMMEYCPCLCAHSIPMFWYFPPLFTALFIRGDWWILPCNNRFVQQAALAQHVRSRLATSYSQHLHSTRRTNAWPRVRAAPRGVQAHEQESTCSPRECRWQRQSTSCSD